MVFKRNSLQFHNKTRKVGFKRATVEYSFGNNAITLSTIDVLFSRPTDVGVKKKMIYEIKLDLFFSSPHSILRPAGTMIVFK